MRLPIVWRWAQAQHDFHNHSLGGHVRHGFHALGMDERREAYAPVMWACPPGWKGHMEQVWFKGNHGDVGGQVGDYP
ncbi:phospholipase effector Tle1 domain-containing protein, partial [Yoonia sp. SDW83-1]|uniref:phospholipase effector Tle1 domain-containing protein n=1 Tax=Yoonia sp. SDW83-1 TaxID=3366945 RepID=UPI00398C355C